MTDAQRAQIERLLNAGKTQAEVAVAVGLTKSSIGKYALRKGLGKRGPRKTKRRGAKHEGPRRDVYEWCAGCHYRVRKVDGVCIYCRDIAALATKKAAREG